MVRRAHRIAIVALAVGCMAVAMYSIRSSSLSADLSNNKRERRRFATDLSTVREALKQAWRSGDAEDEERAKLHAPPAETVNASSGKGKCFVYQKVERVLQPCDVLSTMRLLAAGRRVG